MNPHQICRPARVVYGVRRKGPPGPPAGPTLRGTVEGLRGRGQLTAVLGDVLEITAPVFVMYGVCFSGPFFIDDKIVTHTD